MKNFKLRTFIIILTLLMGFIQAESSLAYQVAWTAIQHRTYENGDSGNRLAFEIMDDSGNYVNNAAVVTEVLLKNPAGSTVNLSTLGFDPLYDLLGARYDTENSVWNYFTPLQISGFYADVLDALVVGEYTLEIDMINGQKLTQSISIDFLLDLPVISSRTFQIQSDPDGNVYWTWEIPAQLLTLAKTYDLQVRAGVAAMINGQLDALYWPNIPVQMGFCFVPQSIYQNLTSRGDEIRFAFQVRTSNNIARSYSGRISVKDLVSPVSIIPKKSAVVIPLN